MPTDLDPFRTLLSRIALVGVLFCLLTGILWMDRNGLKDQADGEISFSDVIYFTMVTVTTVGYGDIVPVSTRARLTDALVVTPVRIFIWVIFLGTAYQLAFRQFTEVFRMTKLQRHLDHHIVICGFGHTGYSAAKELLAKGTNPDHILVIDPGEERVRIAGELGVVALRGDASQEELLKYGAFLNEAKAVIIAAGRDDTNALILLTVRHLNSRCRVIVSAKEEENVKLFRRGANHYFPGDLWRIYASGCSGSAIFGGLFRRFFNGWRKGQYRGTNGRQTGCRKNGIGFTTGCASSGVPAGIDSFPLGISKEPQAGTWRCDVSV
jgi:voltage-gated potassium channel